MCVRARVRVCACAANARLEPAGFHVKLEPTDARYGRDTAPCAGTLCTTTRPVHLSLRISPGSARVPFFYPRASPILPSSFVAERRDFSSRDAAEPPNVCSQRYWLHAKVEFDSRREETKLAVRATFFAPTIEYTRRVYSPTHENVSQRYSLVHRRMTD